MRNEDVTVRLHQRVLLRCAVDFAVSRFLPTRGESGSASGGISGAPDNDAGSPGSGVRTRSEHRSRDSVPVRSAPAAHDHGGDTIADPAGCGRATDHPATFRSDSLRSEGEALPEQHADRQVQGTLNGTVPPLFSPAVRGMIKRLQISGRQIVCVPPGQRVRRCMRRVSLRGYAYAHPISNI